MVALCSVFQCHSDFQWCSILNKMVAIMSKAVGNPNKLHYVRYPMFGIQAPTVLIISYLSGYDIWIPTVTEFQSVSKYLSLHYLFQHVTFYRPLRWSFAT